MSSSLRASSERADDRAAGGFDVGDQRRELVAVAPAREDREAFGRESSRDRGADVVARADDGGSGIAFGHAGLLSVPRAKADYTPDRPG